jgi:hypothetical protein
MSTFKLPDIPATGPVIVKKPPVKVSGPAKPSTQAKGTQSQLANMQSTAMPQAGLADTQMASKGPDSSWGITQSSPEQFTAADLLAGDRDIWAKGVILAMVLGKPRCKSSGWR